MLLLAIAAAAMPLAPVGKWNVRYEESYCVLGRLYGDEKKPVTVAWRAIPLSDTIEMVIAEPRNSADFRRGKAVVDFGGQSFDGNFFSYPTEKPGLYMTRVTMDRASFSGSDKPVVATVRPQRGYDISFTLLNSAAAFASLKACIDDTAKQWGVDPAEEAAIATPPKPATDPSHWLTVNDYPMSETRAGQQAISLLLWKIDTTGRITDCRATIPSGSAVLDKAGCDAITKRGRYAPARDAAGNLVPAYETRRIVWAMPGGLMGDRR